MQALNAGKHVIVEIPAALSLAEAQELSALSKRADRRVLVCHTMRSFPALREVRRRIDAGELHISHIVSFFGIPRRHNQSWAGQRDWIDNLLWHHGCHQVDASLWVLRASSVAGLSAHTGRIHPTFGMAMDVSLHYSIGDQLFTHALTYNTEQFMLELRFIGDEHVLTYRNGQLLDGEARPVLPEFSWLDLTVQDGEMLATLSAGQETEFDIDSVLPTMEVLHSADILSTSHQPSAAGRAPSIA
jgi:2-hydroxy-4-carboxymuconate semialdehyde hemiacetal dehydrogenase